MAFLAFNSQTCGRENVLRRPWAPSLMHLPVFVSEMKIEIKTFNKGSLGSRIDEERSEARNVV
jgi:hypothetical protein